MKIFILKNWHWLALIIVAWVAGFFMGRNNSKIVKSVEYIKGERIIDSIPYPVAHDSIIYQTVDSKNLLPTKPDTVSVEGEKQSYTITQKVDTAAIVADFAKERKYSNELFNDKTKGRLVVNTSVQLNKLKGMGYDFTPIEKIVSIEKRKTFTPFVNASYNSFNQVAAGGGIFVKNIGVGAKYVKDMNTGKTGVEGGLYIKF